MLLAVALYPELGYILLHFPVVSNHVNRSIFYEGGASFLFQAVFEVFHVYGNDAWVVEEGDVVEDGMSDEDAVGIIGVKYVGDTFFRYRVVILFV